MVTANYSPLMEPVEIAAAEYQTLSENVEDEYCVEKEDNDTIIRRIGVAIIPSIKRKANVSPGVISISDDEEGTASTENRHQSTITSERRVTKKKKAQESTGMPSDHNNDEATSSIGRSADSDRSIKTNTTDRERKSTNKNPTPRVRRDPAIIVSSEDEEAGIDYAPEDLRMMGAIAAGTLGICSRLNRYS